MNVTDFAVEHPYYCSDNNYYERPTDDRVYETATDFLEEFEDADIDMNLIFRWDIHTHDVDGFPIDTPWAEVFIIHQRKGLFAPCMINSIAEDEINRFITLLKQHWTRLVKMWEPVSSLL